MSFVLFSRKTYFLTIAALLLLFASTLYHRIAHFDDAWCTEQSYWLLKQGIVRSELFNNYNGWGERMYVFHKLFVYAQVPVLGIMGDTIWAARLLPMLFSLVGLGLLLRYFRGQPEPQWLAAVLYVGCGCLWIFGVDNRPETMTVAFGFGSFLLVQRGGFSSKTVLLAGALAGLAALTHLNGVVYVAAGTFWLFFRAGWAKALLFGLAGSLVAGLYLADALAAGQLGQLLYQFSHDHAAQSNFHLADKLAVMAHYDTLFFHSDGEVPLTVLFLVVVLVLLVRRETRRILTPAMQYLLWLLGTFWLLTKSTNVYYFLLLVPFFIVVAVELIFAVLPLLMRVQRRVIVLICCLYPLGGVARTRFLWLDNQTDVSPSIMAENAELASHMPLHDAKVIAPLDFFFGQVSNYRVRSLTYFALTNPDQPLNDFFAAAAHDTVRYVVCDYRDWNQAYHIPRTAPAQIGQYRRVFQDQWRGVYVARW